jgi:hypothetical protein
MIAWLAGRDGSTRSRVINHRHDSIVAIANTPEPNAEWEPCPLSLALPPLGFRTVGEGAFFPAQANSLRLVVVASSIAPIAGRGAGEREVKSI